MVGWMDRWLIYPRNSEQDYLDALTQPNRCEEGGSLLWRYLYLVKFDQNIIIEKDE